MYTLEQLNTMKGAELKEILREKKLTMSGAKAVLIQRIVEFQENEIKKEKNSQKSYTNTKSC